jgi:hypothetical protein
MQAQAVLVLDLVPPGADHRQEHLAVRDGLGNLIWEWLPRMNGFSVEEDELSAEPADAELVQPSRRHTG